MIAPHVYMAVTADRYELPLAVADSAGELAALLGISKGAVWQRGYCTRVGRDRHPGKVRGYIIVKVDLDGEEDDDG